MKFKHSELPSQEVFPGYHGRFVHSNHMTQALWEIEKGYPVPLHSHHNEQIVNVLDGEYELTVDGQPHLLSAGDVFVIPPNVPHSGMARTDCHLLDIFSPVREDYRF